MLLETEEAAKIGGRREPQLVCNGCGSTVPWTQIAENACKCGAVPVQRDFALSAPDRALRLYTTALSDLSLFHQDGRGLEAREACTACTECFVCKQTLNAQDCAWDEIPLTGLQEHTSMTHQYVYLHPGCFAEYEVWLAAYLERVQTEEAEREAEAERREYCLSNALCLECEKPLSLLDRFAGRLRHYNCALNARKGGAASKSTKSTKSGKNTKKRTK
ncbi:MAG: hypothetical protein JWN14_1963 [Chthonomonadales bacterium]|nr:hypothetical protein [Chthonomonadales bacterium]